jgi:hypothetical protein
MKSIRYLVGIIGLLLVWGVIASVVKVLVIYFISPGQGTFTIPGSSWNSWTWRDVPGNVLGAVAGIQSFRVSTREPREGSNKFKQGFTWGLGFVALILAAFVGYYLYQNL